jgi:DNA-binding transcriptional ArsR family regulator
VNPHTRMRFAFLDSLLQFNSGPGLQLPAGLSSFCRSGATFAGWTAGVWQSKAMTLDPIQLRVLGTLIEKEITTPENYPLSLNALISGCNQKSSRQPVMDLSEDEVRGALRLLEESGFVAVSRDGRVPKYEHRARTVLNLRRDHTAILCLLLLRGPRRLASCGRGQTECIRLMTLKRSNRRSGG